jgi:hypothetical protein
MQSLLQCGGNVHTALKRQAPLRLLIPRQQTKADSNTKIEDAMYPMEKRDSVRARQVLLNDVSPTQITCKQHSGSPRANGWLCVGVCSSRRQLSRNLPFFNV